MRLSTRGLSSAAKTLGRTLAGANSGGGPTIQEYAATKNVFGSLGEQLKDIKKAWETTVLRAAGHEPQWVLSALTPESRQQLAAVDVHFHDLRHEAGCRWLEQGWPIHHVQEMLGHANLSQTQHVPARIGDGPAGVDAPLRRRAWQTRGKRGADRASAR